jgi:hypothetical protein
MLFLIDITTSPDMLWFYWPLFGWGLGLVVHALRVFGGTLGSNWEEKKIAELMSEE